VQNVQGGATATNTLFDDSCGGVDIESLGHNLVTSATGCDKTDGPGDIEADDAVLGPLSDNGGPTDTFALLQACWRRVRHRRVRICLHGAAAECHAHALSLPHSEPITDAQRNAGALPDTAPEPAPGGRELRWRC
jgi:hypothetical protein